MLVKQLMSHPAVACQLSDNLSQAAKLMWERDYGVVPVITPDGQAVAMLTDRDISMAAYTQGKPLAEIGVRSAMSQSLLSCHPEDSVSQAEALMREHQIRRLPVVDSAGQLVGVLSLNDVALASMHQHPSVHGNENGVSLSSTAQTLAALCAHRLDTEGHKLS